MKVALHKVTIFPGRDFTPGETEKLHVQHLPRSRSYAGSFAGSPSPPFGSDAARPARDGAVYMRQVGVVSCVVLRTDLETAERRQGRLIRHRGAALADSVV